MLEQELNCEACHCAIISRLPITATKPLWSIGEEQRTSYLQGILNLQVTQDHRKDWLLDEVWHNITVLANHVVSQHLVQLAVPLEVLDSLLTLFLCPKLTCEALLLW